MMRQMLINKISKTHDEMLKISMNNNCNSISELDSVCGDIAYYFEEDGFNDFTIIELIKYIVYIKKLLKDYSINLDN